MSRIIGNEVLTTNCPDCGVGAGQFCKPDCDMGKAGGYRAQDATDWFKVIVDGAKRTGCDKKLSIHNVRHIAEAVREELAR